MPAPKGNKYAKGHGKNGPDKYTDAYIEKEARAFLEWMERPDSIFMKTFAVERGYSPQRLSEFADKNKVFSEVYHRAKGWQESKLVVGGLMKRYDSSMTKFVLANHHGYKDKNEVSGDNVNPLAVIMERIAQNARDPLDGQD